MTIREARPEDAPAMARVRVDTWRHAYRGIMPDETLDNLSYEAVEQLLRRILWEEASSSIAYVAESADGSVVGLAVAGQVLDPTELEYRGEVYILYVLPDHQRGGHGRGLLRACALRLKQTGLTSLMLWVLEQNPARGFYERMGGRPVRRQQVEEGGALLDEICYGWDAIDLLCR
jgi:ribosomal protein S18 acetylase RimI-like enzyme